MAFELSATPRRFVGTTLIDYCQIADLPTSRMQGRAYDGGHTGCHIAGLEEGIPFSVSPPGRGNPSLCCVATSQGMPGGTWAPVLVRWRV